MQMTYICLILLSKHGEIQLKCNLKYTLDFKYLKIKSRDI